MRVLVIGGSGFTGQRVVRACPDDWSVFALARSDRARDVVEGLGATVVRGDLDEPATVAAALRTSRPDAILCLASLGFGHGQSLVETISDWGRPRAVFTSTTAIFTSLQPPTKPVRLAAEQAITASPLPATIVRPTMIYGRPGDRNIERLLRWLHRIPVVAAPRGAAARQQPVHVDDLAATVVGAVDRPAAIDQSFNVPGPTSLSFPDLVHQAADALGRRGRVVPVPLGPLRMAVAAHERIARSPRLKAEQIDRLVEDKSFDLQAAAEVLGHSPRPFAQGVSEEAGLLGLGR